MTIGASGWDVPSTAGPAANPQLPNSVVFTDAFGRQKAVSDDLSWDETTKQLGIGNVTRNGLTFKSTAAAAAVTRISATGIDAGISIEFQSKGTGNHTFQSAGGTAIQFRVRGDNTTAANFLDVFGAQTGGGVPVVRAEGVSDTNISILFASKGIGSVYLGTQQGTSTEFQVTNSGAAASRWIAVAGSNGSNPSITTSAGDLNIRPNSGTGRLLIESNAQGVPVSPGLALYMGLNRSAGGGEVNIYNGYTGAVNSFDWRQVVVNGVTDRQLMTLSNVGQLRLSPEAPTPAGGLTTVGILLGLASFGLYFGSGAPTISAAKGSLYLRSDGSATNNRMYVNTDGGTTWTAVTTVA